MSYGKRSTSINERSFFVKILNSRMINNRITAKQFKRGSSNNESLCKIAKDNYVDKLRHPLYQSVIDKKNHATLP